MGISLTFRLSGATYAVPIEPVDEVLPFLPIEPVPGAPHFMKGVIFVRGHLIPVLDAAERLGIARSHPGPVDPHIIAFRLAGRLVGLIVDEAIDLVRLPESMSARREEFFVTRGPLAGMTESEGSVYRVLNPEWLLEREETEVLDRKMSDEKERPKP